MAKPVGIRQTEEALYSAALAKVALDESKACTEQVLEDALVSVLPDLDQEREKRRRAKNIIDSLAKGGATEPQGTLFHLMDIPYEYEPKRLIRDDAGNIVENRYAKANFKTADAQRANDHARKSLASAHRKQVEADALSRWALDEALKGRPAAELTWDACVREQGYWRPVDETMSDDQVASNSAVDTILDAIEKQDDGDLSHSAHVDLEGGVESRRGRMNAEQMQRRKRLIGDSRPEELKWLERGIQALDGYPLDTVRETVLSEDDTLAAAAE